MVEKETEKKRKGRSLRVFVRSQEVFKTIQNAGKEIRNRLYYILPSNTFWGAETRQYYSFLMKSQWWDYEQLEAFQLKKLSRLLDFASRYVPFYHRLFHELAIRPEDIRSIADLKQFPVIDKTFVNNNYGDFVPRFAFRNVRRAVTSGSSGQALELKWHPDYLWIKTAANYRFLNWSKWNWRGKGANFGAPMFDLGDEVLYKRDFRKKSWNFNTKKMDEEAIEDILKTINRIEPDFIGGYPSTLYLIADYIQHHGKGLKKHPRSITTTSEILHDHMRTRIEEIFETKVYDWYGMIEGCASAGQCEYGNYHLNMEYNIVEFLEQDGVTKIVGTNLDNLAFPLIRYDTGDVGEFGGFDCPCRRGLPYMKMLQGRAKNYIKTPHGKIDFFPNYFQHILQVPIKDFKIVQRSIYQIDLYIVEKASFTDADLRTIKEGLGKYVGQDVQLNILPVEHIERGPRGKHQVIQSNIR